MKYYVDAFWRRFISVCWLFYVGAIFHVPEQFSALTSLDIQSVKGLAIALPTATSPWMALVAVVVGASFTLLCGAFLEATIRR